MLLDARDEVAVVGEAADGLEAVTLTRQTQPDIVLMDIRMPVMDGVEATRIIAGMTGPAAPRVIILTTFDLDHYVYDALGAGASGFLLKDTLPADLLRAIAVVAAGEAMLDPSVTRRLIARFAGGGAPRVVEPVVLSELSPREGEVLRLLARGLSNAEIAAALVVNETTVKSHVAHLLTKLGLRDRVQAVVYAYESGFIAPGGG
ncbi:MAG: response regulator transcription factor [Chloroflexota bacterium]|nr:response regulator transcription factor [Chloroflexota bacterium]